MLKILYLYPELMNLYGDRGNLTVLQRRCAWYGVPVEIIQAGLGEEIPFSSADMVFMGGGSDHEKAQITHDLLQHADELMHAVEKGIPVLAVGGAYQILGKEYIDSDGKACPGLNLFPFYTETQTERLSGDIVIECVMEGQVQKVIGFENHSGRTWLDDKNLCPWGKVLKGYGNNGEDGTEGFQFQNLVGTYMHGPLLPKNPQTADFFLKKMFARKDIIIKQPLDDSLENFAHQQVLERLISS